MGLIENTVQYSKQIKIAETINAGARKDCNMRLLKYVCNFTSAYGNYHDAFAGGVYPGW